MSASRQHSNSGFSLLETLTALTILAIALVALFQAQGSGASTTTASLNYGHARILADSLLAETLARTGRRIPKSQSGKTGKFNWKIKVTPNPEAWARAKRQKKWRLHTISVSVNWARNRTVELQTVKLFEK